MSIWKKKNPFANWISNIPIWVCPLFLIFCKFDHLQYARYFKNSKNIPICNATRISKKFRNTTISKNTNYVSNIFICISQCGSLVSNICVFNFEMGIFGYMPIFWVIFKNMPIYNMPIFIKIQKYVHVWYAHFCQ